MPAGKQDQSGPLLYGLITFVVLFLVATTLAIMSYLKLEDANNAAHRASASRTEMAKTLREAQKDFDSLYSLVTGMVAQKDEDTHLKLEQVQDAAKEVLDQVNKDGSEDTNLETTAILPTMSILLTQRNTAIENANNLTKKMKDMQQRWDLEVAGFRTGEEKLIADRKACQQQADEVLSNVEKIHASDKEANEQRLKGLKQKLEEKDNKLKETSKLLEAVTNNFKASDKSRRELEMQLESIRPRPDIEVEAFKPDAKVVSVDLQTGIAYINIGSKDKVYRGLTFGIYDRVAPIPLDGKGKAEVKVFDVQESISAVKIVSMDKKNPIITDDIAINLIWNKETPNTFVVAGAFDFDGDGKIDYNGRDQIVKLIEQWGGIVVDKIDINTDFIVLGNPPRKLPKPTETQMDSDQLAMDKYEQAKTRYDNYSKILSQAKALSIPVFNTERFKNLIGFDTEARMSKPF